MAIALNIMVGTACNWKCKYCIQTDEKGFNKKHNINAFCENFIKYIKNTNSVFKRIAYWGGEPCLYWDYIKTIESQVVDKLPSHFIEPSRFITNGSLLTLDDVDYLNDRNMLVNVSYHQGELSEEQWIVALHIRRLYVTSLITHNTLTYETYYDKWKYLTEKYGRVFQWLVHYSKTTTSMDDQFAITLQDVDDHFEYLYSIIKKGYTDIFFRRQLELLFYNFWEHDYFEGCQNFCYNNNVLSIDLEGNKYFCHHDCQSQNIVGNIFHQIPIYNEQQFLDNLPGNTLQCKNCPLYQRCLGGCFRNKHKQISCYLKLKTYNFLKYIQQNHYDAVDSYCYRYLDLK